MKVVIEVPDKLISDSVIAGLQSGMTYLWCDTTAARSDDHLDVVFLVKDGDVFSVERDAWPHIIATMAIKHPQHLANILSGYGDARSGDALNQYACFGEIKYGDE